jgi:hypothetical protein
MSNAPRVRSQGASHVNGRFGVVSDNTADRLPPQNLEAEQGVLGSILWDKVNGVLAEIVPILRPDDFYRDAHQVIFRAMADMFAEERNVDSVTLADELTRRDQYEKIGGDDTLREIIDSVRHELNAKFYARIIRETAISRTVVEKCELLIRDAYARTYTGPELGERMRRAAEEIGTDSSLTWIETEYATLEDVDRKLGEEEYAWDLWIARGALAAVVADPGVGKTRLIVEWCRRLWLGLPWPDGSPNPFPAGTKTLWLCYDRHWRGLIRTFKQFGIPLSAMVLPSHRGKPLYLPDFDSPETMQILRRFIEVHKTGWTVIDSTTYASRFNTGKPNESKIAYDPIMDVLMDTNQPGLGITHTNREGGLLNRRLLERCRTQITVSRPDPAQPNRIRVEVEKSEDKKPPAIGAEFHDADIAYDKEPPTKPEAAKRGRPAKSSPGLAEFLWDFLQQGPIAVVKIVDAARDKGLLKAPTEQNPKPSISPLYEARDWVQRLHPEKFIHEFKAATQSGKMLKHWELADGVEPADQAESTADLADEDDGPPF